MAFFRHPLVRRVLTVLLVGYLVYGPAYVAVWAAANWGVAGFLSVLALAVATIGAALSVLPRNAPGSLLPLVLVGGLAVHAIVPGAGLAFPFLVIYRAPYLLRTPWAIALCVGDVAATVVVSLRAGFPADATFGVSAGLVYCAVLAFLIRLRVTRAQADMVAEARAREAAQAERTRLAREIHDILAHSQSAQIVHLEGARLLLERGRDGDVPAALDRVTGALRLARGGLEETRMALDALRGHDLPLPERLERLAVEFSSATGEPCRVQVGDDHGPLSAAARVAVARTAQEALTNVRKHAPGASAAVTLRRTAGWCELEVRDRGGTGEPVTASAGGYGLIGMRERAELIGGSLVTEPGADGFRVLLRVPVSEREVAV